MGGQLHCSSGFERVIIEIPHTDFIFQGSRMDIRRLLSTGKKSTIEASNSQSHIQAKLKV